MMSKTILVLLLASVAMAEDLSNISNLNSTSDGTNSDSYISGTNITSEDSMPSKRSISLAVKAYNKVGDKLAALSRFKFGNPVPVPLPAPVPVPLPVPSPPLTPIFPSPILPSLPSPVLLHDSVLVQSEGPINLAHSGIFPQKLSPVFSPLAPLPLPAQHAFPLNAPVPFPPRPVHPVSLPLPHPLYLNSEFPAPAIPYFASMPQPVVGGSYGTTTLGIHH